MIGQWQRATPDVSTRATQESSTAKKMARKRNRLTFASSASTPAVDMTLARSSSSSKIIGSASMLPLMTLRRVLLVTRLRFRRARFPAFWFRGMSWAAEKLGGLEGEQRPSKKGCHRRCPCRRRRWLVGRCVGYLAEPCRAEKIGGTIWGAIQIRPNRSGRYSHATAIMDSLSARKHVGNLNRKPR